MSDKTTVFSPTLRADGADAQGSGTTPVVDIHDRIMDAYYGRMGESFMRKTQERIHWVCAQAQGQTILDVGCSQGIGPILLAREGKTVVGVDSDPAAVNVAIDYLAMEPDAVQKRLTFLNADFMNANLAGRKFDVVVMSEVLEHLVNPASFVEMAASLLQEGGRLVVTVPFGINDFIDHKHTFYLFEPYRMMNRWFEVVDVKIFGRWIGLVGKRRKVSLNESSAVKPDAALLRLCESAFYDIERQAQDDLSSAKVKLDEVNRKYRTITEQIAALKQKSTQEQLARQEAESRLADMQARAEKAAQLQATLDAVRAQLEAANIKYRDSTQRYDELRMQLAAASQSLADERNARQVREEVIDANLKAQADATQEARIQFAKTEAALEALKAQLENANQKYRESTQRYDTVKGKLAEEEAAARALTARVTELQTQLSATVQTLTDERQRRQEEEHVFRGELRKQAETAQNALIQLARAEVSLEAMRSQLESANLKYRDSTQRYEELKSQLVTVNQSLAEERKTWLAQEASLNADLRAQADATQDARIQAARAEAILEGLRTQMDAANLKYHESTQRYDDLKAQLAQEIEAQLKLQVQVSELQAALTAASAALTEERNANETKNSALRVRLDESEQALYEARLRITQTEDDANSLRDQLNTANLKYRDNTQRYAQIKDQLAQSESARNIATAQAEKLKLDVLKSKQSLLQAELDIERQRNEKLQAEAQVAKTRAMLSFQLGYAIIHAFKSFRGFIHLPIAIYRIIIEARRRRTVKAAKVFRLLPKASVSPPTAAVTNRIHVRVADTVPAAKPIIVPAAESSALRSLVPTPDASMVAPVSLAQRLRHLRVACIMDEFTFSSYRPECNLIQLTPAKWEHELTEFKPELLFIESAWRGKDDLWGSKVGHLSQEVQGILAWCRTHKVPTVFWNKEDPIHFETFLNTARLFDHVFTTDIDCIHRYKAALGHDRVYLLPFAAQPEHSNPIEKYERKDAFCFAGAYYVRYPDRTADLGNFVHHLAEYRGVEIYDRNFGKDDANYQFPEEYQPFIVGNLPFDQIDKAYKGYRYAINLNSIKQSQSMFARRVYELLASNTITVSNFSRGVRLLFGDLVITSDSGEEIVRRVDALLQSDSNMRKFRLAGLRKVMMGHTYQDRFAYLISKVQGAPVDRLLPGVVVTAFASNQQEFDALMESYKRQSHSERRCIVVVPDGFAPAAPDDDSVKLMHTGSLNDQTLGSLAKPGELFAGMVADDYYGPNYLLDMVLATRYSHANAIGKVTHYSWLPNAGLSLTNPDKQYHLVSSLPARCAVVNVAMIEAVMLKDWATSLSSRTIEATDLLAIDEFNYCRYGIEQGFDAAAVDDLQGLDVGMSPEVLIGRAEHIPPAEATADEAPVLTGSRLASYFKPSPNRGYSVEVQGAAWEISSTLADGKHEYLYASTDLSPNELGFNGDARFHFDVSTGLNLQVVLLFLDAQKQRISHVVKTANRNQEAAIPVGTEWIRLGLRIYGSGTARINGLVLGHRPLRPAAVLGRADHLVLTNHYPSYDDLYRNGFVHSRVKAYAAAGVDVDVFRLRSDSAVAYHEFQDIDVITGSSEALTKLLETGGYKSILVHFLDEEMWSVLQHYVDRVKIIVWVHGAEIQPWHRRDYNFTSEQERDAAKAQSEVRMRFWRELFADLPDGLRFVFVSRYFAEEVMEDVGIRLPESSYEVIHNPIDTDCFAYHAKPAEQRMRILSIRPYASRKYANDLSVGAILELSKKPYFKDLEFRMIGDGKLFDETLEPIKGFENVVIERRFLSHNEIGALHKDYGIFLCPTRMDAQGVSRDEAMSSGLVPVTNGVTAIPEFVDSSCGILAGPDDAEGMANGIAMLIEQPETFMRMSAAAAARVRQQSPVNLVASQEIAAFLHAHP